MEEILDQPQLGHAADERRLEPGGRAALAAALGRDPQRLPQRHGLRLALELVLARVGVGDRRLGGAPGRLADEHHSRVGRGLDASGGVDEVTGDHPLTLGAHRDGGLTGEHARARREIRVDRGHGRDEVECGAHRALGVVLVRDRCAPDGHHRVADELLERAAVALDDLTSDVEVAGQELARVLRVPRLGGCREADQVGEEDGDESPLGCGRCGGDGLVLSAHERFTAFAAELRAGRIRRATRGTGDRERGTALAAELPARLVLRATGRAGDHVRAPPASA